MLFSSLTFLYCFLPAVIAVYFLLPKRLHNGVLLLFSLFFYSWGEPRYLLLMLLCITVFYLCGLQLERSRNKKFWLWTAVVYGLGQLAVFKYLGFFGSILSALTGGFSSVKALALPMGISFYTFQCIGYAVDVYRGQVKAQRSFVDFAAYVALFPQLVAGPIVRYQHIQQELCSRQSSWESVSCGLGRFLVGLGKKVLLANALGALVTGCRDSSAPSVLYCWISAAAYFLQIYFDFSGYSDMAIGLGRIFGFTFPENFNYPYLSGSVTEFWRRWHMTLGSWFRDYVYIPLGGNRVSRGKWVRNVLLVWMLTGFWHGAGWNFILWGAFFAALLLLEKSLRGIRVPGVLRHGYVILAVLLSFVLFRSESLAQAGGDYLGMFGLSGLPLVNTESLYTLRSSLVLFAAAALGVTPLPKRLFDRLPGSGGVLRCLGMTALLLLTTACLVDGSYNPFLYFRF